MKTLLYILTSFFLIALSVTFAPNVQSRIDTDSFTIAVLPDTQYYSQSYPSVFDQQTQWIANNAATQNIVFVSHLGDIVNDSAVSKQWQNAAHSMRIIRNAGIPYSVVPGNHDLDQSAGNPVYFDKYFPYTDFTGYSWYGGHYPSDSNVNNYELFSALGQNFIILNLVCTPRLLSNATVWANNVLIRYSDREAIVVTHGYLDAKGNYTDDDWVSGIEIWNNIVKLHSNIVMVLCGHLWPAYHNTATGDMGNKIDNLLTDYQDRPHGGDGWLRLYKFYPRLNKVSAITYSPYLNKFDTSPEGRFDLWSPSSQ